MDIIIDQYLQNCGNRSEYQWGYSSVEPTSFDFFQSWLEQNLHGEMKYLENYQAPRSNPKNLLPAAQTAIMITKSYVTLPLAPNLDDFSLPIAAYAKGKDYHHWFYDQVSDLGKELKKHFPQHEFLPFSDTRPILERDAAVRAGLGWIGKNSCLISENQGSLNFIGGLLTSLPTSQFEKSIEVAHDRCGNCTKCMEACPTQAILSDRSLDARRCISYLTIEAKSSPPIHLRDKMDSLFGCDICQVVCPWNAPIEIKSPKANEEVLLKDLRFLLTATSSAINKKFKNTPLMRAQPIGLRRNAILLTVHYQFVSLCSELSPLTSHPILGELATWAMERLNNLRNFPKTRQYHPPFNQA